MAQILIVLPLQTLDIRLIFVGHLAFQVSIYFSFFAHLEISLLFNLNRTNKLCNISTEL